MKATIPNDVGVMPEFDEELPARRRLRVARGRKQKRKRNYSGTR